MKTQKLFHFRVPVLYLHVLLLIYYRSLRRHTSTQVSHMLVLCAPFVRQVRCMVGGMSAVTFRNLGACRVQVFLRLGSGSPAQRFHVSPATKLTRAATAAMDASTQEVRFAAERKKSFVSPRVAGVLPQRVFMRCNGRRAA